MKENAVKIEDQDNQDSDCEVINPPNNLKDKVRVIKARPGEKLEDPVAKAEQELKKLEPHFKNWLDQGVMQLCEAWQSLSGGEFTSTSVEPLYRASHDIKGQAGMLGQPHAGSVAANLCQLLENEEIFGHLPHALVEQHVYAIAAIVREGDNPNAEAIAVQLVEELKTVIKPYLSNPNDAEK